MRDSRVKLIALLLSCAGSYAGAADDTAIGLKPGAGGLQLKLQPSLIRIPPDNKDPVPLFVDADQIQGHQDREIEAEGTVRLRRRGQAVSADWLRYDKPEDEVNAQRQCPSRAARRRARGNQDAAQSRHRTRRDGKTEVPGPGQCHQRAAAKADRIVFEGQGKYRVLGGSYTSCDVGNDDWFVRASDFEIDKERQIGTAHNASVVFLGAPILYTPYLSFSLDRQRKSGFLSPTFGTTGNSGTNSRYPITGILRPTATPRSRRA